MISWSDIPPVSVVEMIILPCQPQFNYQGRAETETTRTAARNNNQHYLVIIPHISGDLQTQK